MLKAFPFKMNDAAKRDQTIPSRMTSLVKRDPLFANDAAAESWCCWGTGAKSQLQASTGLVSMEYNATHHIHSSGPVPRWAGSERMCVEMPNQQIGTSTECCLVGDVDPTKR